MALEDILRSSENFRDGLDKLLNTEIEPILFDDNDKFNTVWGLFQSADENKGLMKTLNKNAIDLLSVLNSKRIEDELKEVIKTLFPRKNKETGLKDAPVNAYYSVYIPLAIYCKLVVPQLDEQQNLYFNATGNVTVGDFFDSFNALFEGYNSEEDTRTSIDNVSYDTDYFNKGYNRFVTSYGNPIYNLYNRIDFIRPITRAEVAYLLVFGLGLLDTEKRNYLTTDYTIGYTFDWVTDTNNILKNYTDCTELEICVNQKNNYIHFDLASYLGDSSIAEYFENIQKGTKCIALPLISSLLELCNNGIMNDDTELNPIGELSRGELIYIMFNVCNLLFKKEKEKGE